MKIRFAPSSAQAALPLESRKIEFIQLKKQIEFYATFLPNYLLNNPEFETKSFIECLGVILDINIRGMNRLIKKYNKISNGGIYKSTQIINSYLSVIIEIVNYWGGDVLKIIGNRCIILWKVQPEEMLSEVLHLVIIAACTITDALEDFDTKIQQKLKLKMAMTCGNISIYRYGTETKLLVVRGDPMKGIKQMSLRAKPGEILISTAAWPHMVHDRYKVTKLDDVCFRLDSGVIAYRRGEKELFKYFNAKAIEVRNIVYIHTDYMKNLHTYKRINSIEIQSKLKHEFISKIPTRDVVQTAPMQCELNKIRSYVCLKLQTQIQENQPVEHLTEMNTLTTVMIVVETRFIENLTPIFIEDVYKIIMKYITKDAFIYIFEVTDLIKIVIVNDFNSARHELETQVALRSGFDIWQEIDNLPQVHCISVGIFQCYLYCGVVGHPFRRSYTVLSSVLGKAYNILNCHKGKVICDLKTFKFSKLPSFYFCCINVKHILSGHYKQILVYDQHVETEEVDLYAAFKCSNVLGREKEVELIREMIQNRYDVGRVLIFTGPSKVGKGALLDLALERITNGTRYAATSLVLDELVMIPFFVISKIYRQLYDMNYLKHENRVALENFPVEVLDLHELNFSNERELALTKYKILIRFKEMANFTSEILFIIIKHFNFIDTQSWEMLELLMRYSKLRILGTGTFKPEQIEMLENNENVNLQEVKPLSDYWMHSLACYFLGVGAISKKLSHLITSTCKGFPGHLQSCLTYFISSESMYISLMLKEHLSKEAKNYIPIHAEIFKNLPSRIAVMSVVDGAVGETDKSLVVTITSITKDFYNSLGRFEQNIVRTASVLGKLFTRNLLIVALHYPDKDELLDGIKTMFGKNIFECGSKLVNGYNMKGDKFCCRCYMSEDELDDIKGEKYPHCKILHFRNEKLREVVYNLLPTNYKRDLHLMCTDVLENMIHACPTCLRDPINLFVVMTKYRDVMDILENNTNGVTKCPEENTMYLKDCIRSTIRGPPNWKIKPPRTGPNAFRTSFDPTKCNCFELLLFVYKQLISHSQRAQHLSKYIFFSLGYGRVLILAKDVKKAISILREAQELSLSNIHNLQSELTEDFRKYSVGRISLALAYAFFSLRQLNQAKNYIVIALRQHNIPSLVINYVQFRALLTKPFFLNDYFYLRPKLGICKWTNWEIAMCLITCARIYAAEGNLKYAKQCTTYSIWILKQMNDRFPMLLDTYCDVIDLYRYGLDTEMCEKLQRYVSKEILLNYCNNQGFNCKYISHLLVVKFELKLIKGELRQAINLCYRVIDFTLKAYVYIHQIEIVSWLSLIFCYTMRFKEFVDLMTIVKKNIIKDSYVWYHSNALEICLMTGYSYIPIDTIFKDLLGYFNLYAKERMNWEKNFLLSQLYLYLLKSSSSHLADQYIPICPFTNVTLRRPIVMRILLNMIEGEMVQMYRIVNRGGKFDRLKTLIMQKLEMALVNIKHMIIFAPRMYCLQAWFYKLFGEPRKAWKFLGKAEKISKRQNNLYYIYFVRELKNSWKRRYTRLSAGSLDSLNLQEAALHFTEEQWAKVIPLYPV